MPSDAELDRALWSLRAYDTIALASASESGPHVAAYFLQRTLAYGLPELFRTAHAAGASTSIDPNWDPREQWDHGLRELLKQTDVFLPNAAEVVRIADEGDPRRAARVLAESGPLVAVKLGTAGAFAAAGSGVLTEASAVKGIAPIDTIGAGDSFDAGFLAALLTGRNVQSALSLGCACGGLSTRAVGATAAQPTPDEAQAVLEATEHAP